MYYYKTIIKTKQYDYIDRLFDNPEFGLNDLEQDKFIRTRTYLNDSDIPGENLDLNTKSLVRQAEIHVNNIINEVLNFYENNNPEEMYNEFKIPKRTGGFRTIDAPNEALKEVQYRVLKELKSIKVLPHDSAWAYIKGRDVVSALKEHQSNSSRWFLKLDLKDFFGSCDLELLTFEFKKLYPFCFMEEEIFDKFINTLFIISSKDGKLPQGTPLSPYLTNLIMVPFDYEINKMLNDLVHQDLLLKQRYVYTRYADDILISAKESFNADALIDDIKLLMQRVVPGLVIKDEKTRYGSSNGRNWNLGIMYNKDKELTIGTRKKKYLKQAIYNFITNIESFKVNDVQVLVGQLSWLRNVEPEYFKGLMQYYKDKHNVDVWERLLDILRAE